MTDEPAFPRPMHIDPDRGCLDNGATGMTLRDWFAGQALPAILQLKAACKDRPDQGLGPDIPESAAFHAYRIADAMIQERDNESG